MRRVLIVHFTPPGVVGGVESIIHEHARHLSARGFQVEIAAGRAGDVGLSLNVVPEIEAAGPEASRLDDELAAGVVSPLFWGLRNRIAARLQPLADAADSLIVHNAFTLHFNLALTSVLWDIARARPPESVIAWCHDLSWVNPLYIPRMHEGFPWNLLRLPAPHVAYVVISEERKRELRGLWVTDEPPITVIPNGIDPAVFLGLSGEVQEIVQRYRLFDRDAVLLLPVRVTRRKNIEAGIRATRALVDRGLDPLFLVSGPRAPHHPGLSDGYLGRLLALTDELQVNDHVVFLTHELGRTLDADTVNRLYAVSDALLFPSAHEGFGLPILEAGLARIPAIVSDIPVFREVSGGDVWTFDPDAQPDTIASVIVEALDGRPSRLFRRVLRRYRWDVIVDQDIVPLLDPEANRVSETA
jgi:glycosyltransferase involved in cell wall biosynthesis